MKGLNAKDEFRMDVLWENMSREKNPQSGVKEKPSDKALSLMSAKKVLALLEIHYKHKEFVAAIISNLLFFICRNTPKQIQIWNGILGLHEDDTVSETYVKNHICIIKLTVPDKLKQL